MRLAACILALALPASLAADPATDAAVAVAALDEATRSLDEADGARDRVAALTSTITAVEAGLTAVRDGLRQATVREQALTARLDAKEAEVAELLGILQIISRTPGPLNLLHPAGPTGTARSAMILSDVTPALQVQVDTLRAELAEVATLRTLQQTAGATLENGLLALQEARIELSQAIADRGPLPKRFANDPVQMALLIAASETLDGFASGLVELGPADTAAPAIWDIKGQLPLPLQATLLRDFGEADAAGITRPGLVMASRPGALVTAPAAATLRYVGPLLDYGNVIILEPAADTLMVLAGLSDVYGSVGAVVAAGAPLGLMGGAAGSIDAQNAAETGAGSERTETLYIEVREGDTPVDPKLWFALNKD